MYSIHHRCYLRGPLPPQISGTLITLVNNTHGKHDYPDVLTELPQITTTTTTTSTTTIPPQQQEKIPVTIISDKDAFWKGGEALPSLKDAEGMTIDLDLPKYEKTIDKSHGTPKTTTSKPEEKTDAADTTTTTTNSSPVEEPEESPTEDEFVAPTPQQIPRPPRR